MLGMWNVRRCGCLGFRMFRIWDVGDMECVGCGIGDVWDVGYSGWGMFEM